MFSQVAYMQSILPWTIAWSLLRGSCFGQYLPCELVSSFTQSGGTQFTCFTGAKVQILTQKVLFVSPRSNLNVTADDITVSAVFCEGVKDCGSNWCATCMWFPVHLRERTKNMLMLLLLYINVWYLLTVLRPILWHNTHINIWYLIYLCVIQVDRNQWFQAENKGQKPDVLRFAWIYRGTVFQFERR